MEPFESERLRLRAFTFADAPYVVRQLNDPGFIRNVIDRGVRTEAQAREWMAAGPLASYARHGFGLGAIERKADGCIVGMGGLLKRDTFNHPDLGYALLPEHESQGYAFEAASAVVAAARPRFGIEQLLAVILPGNARSIRLIERLGFARDGFARLPPEETELLRFARATPRDGLFSVGG